VNPGDRYGRSDANRAAFEKGYEDGAQKGRDDAHGHRDADPVRHSWYRSGTRGYNDDYGSKEQYKNVYRNGFEQGYMTAYRQTVDPRVVERNGGAVRRWP
jgi:hypothetical protein